MSNRLPQPDLMEANETVWKSVKDHSCMPMRLLAARRHTPVRSDRFFFCESTRMAENKRCQVFVSSTFADLQEERSHVIRTLLEMELHSRGEGALSCCR